MRGGKKVNKGTKECDVQVPTPHRESKHYILHTGTDKM